MYILFNQSNVLFLMILEGRPLAAAMMTSTKDATSKLNSCKIKFSKLLHGNSDLLIERTYELSRNGIRRDGFEDQKETGRLINICHHFFTSSKRPEFGHLPFFAEDGKAERTTVYNKCAGPVVVTC